MYRLVSVDGRAALEHDGAWFDLAALVDDQQFADPLVALAHSSRLHELTDTLSHRRGDGQLSDVTLGAPVAHPRQVFAIGLNYSDHATESGLAPPPAPLTFTKFPSSIAGPRSTIPLSSDTVDWEVELVVVIGARVRYVEIDDAWDVVAGLTVGQDISDRVVQMTGSPPQFSLGKSFAGFGPIGPAIVSPDALSDRNDVEIACFVNDEEMQRSRTSQLIFPVAELVSYLSSICELFPGDLIFTGTPSGVGASRGRFLRNGDVVRSVAEGIGELVNQCVPGRPARVTG